MADDSIEHSNTNINYSHPTADMLGNNDNSVNRKDFEGQDLVSNYESNQLEWPDEMRQAILECLKQNESYGVRRHLLLDVGCGAGKLTKVLADDFDHVIGVDVSKSMIENARKTVTNSNVKFELVSDDLLPVESCSTDLVTCGISFHYLNTPVFLAECDRILVNGGILACLVYGPNILTTLDGRPIANYSADSSRWKQVFREFHINCGVNETVREIHVSRYAAIFKSLANPTKRWLHVAKSDRKYTVKKMLDYMSVIAGYRTKKYPEPDKDPINIFRQGLVEILRHAGLDGNDDTEFMVTFEFSAMIIEKKKPFGIA